MTDCFASDCAPGQYCGGGPSTSRECTDGCVSDENCSATEHCQRAAGASTGSCRPCAGVSFGAAAPGCLAPDRLGVSDCFATDCGPGLYCTSGAATERECAVGCTSDENCGPSEHCVREGGETIGNCRSCYAVASPPAAGGCREAVARAVECGAIPAAQQGVATAECDADPSGAAPLIACIEASPSCEAVNGCFVVPEAPGAAACRAACDAVTRRCAGELSWMATDAAECHEQCATDLGTLRVCLEAAEAQADPFFGCNDAVACLF